MNTTIIGTGKMARGIAERLLSGGNNVTFVSRDEKRAQEVARELAPKASGGATARGAAAIEGEIVVLATPYSGAIETVRGVGYTLRPADET